jgi:hypothetical protein
MNASGERIDKPELRWQALLALVAIGGIYLALPSWFIVGPVWLLPALIAVLLVPTIMTHRMGRHSLNHVLGIVINAIITLALIGSVALLVRTLPGQKQAPLFPLLVSGAELWITNVLVFALWYWRLDGGGPTMRNKRREFGSRSFIFPQMQIEKIERGLFSVEAWRPGFVDYLFIAFTQSSTFGPTDAPVGQSSHHVPNLHFSEHCRFTRLARGRHPVGVRVRHAFRIIFREADPPSPEYVKVERVVLSALLNYMRLRRLIYLPMRIKMPATSAKIPIMIGPMPKWKSVVIPTRIR